MLKLSRTKLADKPIHWKETYTEDTNELRDMYEDIIGPKSYFRWEGKDADSGDEYVAIVGPASVKDPEPRFFAGVRKLPSDWPAGGEYFSEFKEALNKAYETWGVTMPADVHYYDSSDMRGIAKKVDEWKEQHKTENEKEAAMSEITFIRTASFPYYKKIETGNSDESLYAFAMPAHWSNRSGYKCFDVDSIDANPDYQTTLATETDQNIKDALEQAAELAKKERNRRKAYISEMYGAEYATANAGMYHTWLVYKGNEGIYIYSVGPYCNTHYDQAVNKFGIFRKKLNIVSQDTIDKKVHEMQEQYARDWGIEINPADLNTPTAGTVGDSFAVTIGKSGLNKIKSSPKWQKAMSYWGIDCTKSGWTKLLESKWKEFNDPNSPLRKDYDAMVAAKLNETQLDEAYKQKVQSGEAFLEDMPPPPSPRWAKRAIGQQLFSTIYRAPETSMQVQDKSDTSEKMLKYGFDSISDAVDFLKSNDFKDLPFPQTYQDVTSAELAAAREKKLADDKAKGLATETPGLTGLTDGEKEQVSPFPKVVAPFKKKQKEQRPPDAVPGTEDKVPAMQTVDVDLNPDEDIFGLSKKPDYSNASAIERMVKMAEKLDAEGQYEQAKEIHRTIMSLLGRK